MPEDGYTEAAEAKEDTVIEDLESVGLDYHSLPSRKKIQAVNQHTFPKLYVINGTIKKSVEAMGFDQHTVQLWKQDDALGFNARFGRAIEAFADGLEDIAMSRIRAPEGNRGGDVLLITMLNAHKPDKYRTGIVVVDEVPKRVAAKLAKMAQEDAEERESQAPETRADNITQLERMREKPA